MQIVLASTSAYRAELLKRLSLDFSTIAPDVDESVLPGETPEELVSRLSRLKAETVAGGLADALVIGSDQVAVAGDEILGKPGTIAAAQAQLARLSGRQVVFMTGLAVIDTSDDAAAVEPSVNVVKTPVQFRQLSAQQISRYVEREMPLDCAGAFKSEGLGIALFESIGGTDPSALIGLPLIELCTMLQARGVDVLA